MDERIIMQIDMWYNDNMSIYNELVVKKVQLEEQLKDIEAKIQFQRGVAGAFDKAKEIVKNIAKGAAIEELPTFKLGPGDDHQKEVAKYLDKAFEGV